MQKQMGADSDEQFFKFFLNSKNLKKSNGLMRWEGRNETEIVAQRGLYIKVCKYS